MTAAEHALEAAKLLDAIEATQKNLAELDQHRKLELQVTGGFKRINADVDYTVKLAQAHALTAIALQGSVEDRPPVTT